MGLANAATWRQSRFESARSLLTRFRTPLLVAAIVLFGGLGLLRAVDYWQTSGFYDFELVLFPAAKDVAHGRDPYECARQWQDEGVVYWQAQDPPCHAYVYPPSFAIGLSPLTMLPYSVVKALWFGLSVLAVFGSVFLIARLVPDKLSRLGLIGSVVVGGSIALVTLPVGSSLRLGQTDPLMLFFLTAALYTYVRGNRMQTGIWLAAALLVKPVFWPLVLLLLLRREFRAVGLMACIGLASVAIAGVLIRPHATLDFIQVANYLSGRYVSASPQNQSAYALAVRLFTSNMFTRPLANVPALATAVKLVLPLSAIVALTALVRLNRRDTLVERGLEFGAAVCLCLLASPFFEHTHVAYLLIPMIFIALVVRPSLTPVTATLLVGSCVLIAAVLSVPKIEDLSLAFYHFRNGPLGLRDILMTGTYLAVAAAVTFLVGATLAVYHRALARQAAPALVPG